MGLGQVMMLAVLAVFFLSIHSARAETSCTSEQRCRCFLTSDKELKAACSNLQLTISPNFSSEVRVIDLSYNNLQSFPSRQSLPDKLRYLDVSQNSQLSRVDQNSFSNMSHLEHLDLSGSYRELTSSELIPGIFKDLISLKYLNLKNTFSVSDTPYPEEALSDVAASIETLMVNGKSRGFGPVFLKMKNLTKLDISGNGGHCDLSYIPINYFQNVSNISILDVSDCRLKNLLNGTFAGLEHLTDLNISKNEELSFSILRKLSSDLKHTKIKKLRMNKIHCTFGLGTKITRADIKDLQFTNLTELYIESNRIELMQSGVLMNLPETLEYVSISDNRLTFGWYALETAYMKNLKTFDMSLQYLSHSPLNIFPLCNDERYPRHTEGDSEFESPVDTQNTSYILIDHQQLHQGSRAPSSLSFNITLPKNLHTGYFNMSSLRYFVPYSYIGKNNIKEFYLQGNSLFEWTGPLQGVHTLEVLDMSNNLCSKMSTFFFDYFTGLKDLKINDNILGFDLQADINGSSFKNLRNLTNFEIASNKIQKLPKLIFKNLISLERLILSENLMTSFDVKIDHMSHLKVLNLSSNQLSKLSPELTKQLDRISDGNKTHPGLTVDLSDNHLVCDCDNLEFVRWKTTTNVEVVFDYCKTKFRKSGKVYSEDLSDFLVQLESDCKNYTVLIVLLSCVIVIALSLTACAIVYRYRWKLRYLYYMTKSQYLGYIRVRQPDDDDDDLYNFDAFISYADEDRDFALHEMLEEIENKGGLRLCCHNRDFIPGNDIAENITKAVNSSRRTICVISPNFMKSYWCKFELNMARMESIYSRKGEEVLFLIFYKHCSNTELYSEIVDLIDRKSYIEFPNDPQGNVVFWENLRRTISTHI